MVYLHSTIVIVIIQLLLEAQYDMDKIVEPPFYAVNKYKQETVVPFGVIIDQQSSMHLEHFSGK